MSTEVSINIVSWWLELRLTDKVILMNKHNIEPYKSSDDLSEEEITKIYLSENANPPSK